MEERGARDFRQAAIDYEKQNDVVVPFAGPDGTQVLVTIRSTSVERSSCPVAEAKQCVRALAEAFEHERTAVAHKRVTRDRLDDAVFRAWAYDS